MDQRIQRVADFSSFLFVQQEADILHLGAGLNAFNFHVSDAARQLGKSALMSAIVRCLVDPYVYGTFVRVWSIDIESDALGLVWGKHDQIACIIPKRFASLTKGVVNTFDDSCPQDRSTTA